MTFDIKTLLSVNFHRLLVGHCLEFLLSLSSFNEFLRRLRLVLEVFHSQLFDDLATDSILLVFIWCFLLILDVNVLLVI